MTSKEYLRMALEVSDRTVMPELDGLSEDALTYPTQNGGCHPLWVLGHLAMVEGSIPWILLGEENPLQEYEALFGKGSEPSMNATDYPTFTQLRQKYQVLRRRNLELLDSLSEADLTRATKNPPKGLEHEFATFGTSFLVLAMHQTMHRAHVLDARRSLPAVRVAA